MIRVYRFREHLTASSLPNHEKGEYNSNSDPKRGTGQCVKSLISVIIVAEIAASVFLFGYEPKVPPISVPRHIEKVDPRVAELTTFMQQHRFAKPYYINDYITAADSNNLDWRLLPAIAVVESSGCVHLLKNNCFGWDSDRTGFGTIQEGIHVVAAQLASGRYYRGKTLEQKLKTYNSVNPAYAGNVERLMKELK